MKKNIFLSAFLCLICLSTRGQTARVTPPQFIFNQLPINPAFAGRDLMSSVDMHYFGSGEQFSFLYRTVSATWHGPLDFDNKNNLGLQFQFVNEAGVDEVRLRPSYARRLQTDVGEISFGVVLGYNFFNIDPNSGLFYDPFSSIDMGGGIFFNNDKFFVGLSSLNVFEILLTEERNILGLPLPRENPYYFSAGFHQTLTDRFTLRPSVLLKFSDNYTLSNDEETVSNEYSYDISASLIIEQNYWITIFYGSSNLAEANPTVFDGTTRYNRFGLSLNLISGPLRLGYSIHRTSPAGTNTEFPISHLIAIGYDFGLERSGGIRFY